uniref:Uncharacterized protein n=1 Tax=Knipowitschia caucasica TaxID=637954 RepID=A0AAV2LZC3_KNICA
MSFFLRGRGNCLKVSTPDGMIELQMFPGSCVWSWVAADARGCSGADSLTDGSWLALAPSLMASTRMDDFILKEQLVISQAAGV